MKIIIVDIPPEEIPQLATHVIAALEAHGQSALDIATSTLAMRQTPAQPPVASTEGELP